MNIYFERGTSKETRKELTKACEFFASLLMDPRMIKKLNIHFTICKDFDVQGECICEDDGKYPKTFTINLRNRKGDDPMIKTLAHEMVHLKQHAKNELEFKLAAGRGGYSELVKWQGLYWRPKSKECDYYDAPWEIEAYGREVGLYKRWMELEAKQK